MAANPKRSSRRALGHRRRVDDDGDDEGGPETLDALDDDSMTEGSVISDENNHADDSDTSNVDEASPISPALKKTSGRGSAKAGDRRPAAAVPDATDADGHAAEAVAETESRLHELSISDSPKTAHADDAAAAPSKPGGPVVVSSTSVPSQEPPFERRRREHEEYRKKRDEDPAFVPNRGAFFMHDHRHAGPAANGFRPFGRGALSRGRGRGRGFGGPFAPVQSFQSPFDPTTSAPWSHDMHETVADPVPPRQPRQSVQPSEGLPNGDGHIPTCPPSNTPINRTLSTEKTLGNVEIRVFFPGLKEPKSFSGIAIKRYTKLPDHRPPLRRDKPVRISLPDNPPRYIFPAVDRSFIFIPRALRPNQQRMRGKPRPGLGSVGGYSRRTSVYGGSYYGGSVYTPSVDMSRRSSIAPADFISPTGSAMSRPIVRLPPMARPDMPMPVPVPVPAPAPMTAVFPQPLPVGDVTDAPAPAPAPEEPAAYEPSISDLPHPQTHPLPQKPIFQENRPGSIPMHQPRPQKAVSVENIESPTRQINPPQQYQQAFHQQVPPQVANSLSQDTHARNSSYPSQFSTGTPLSQIPERAIHAAPFQPSAFTQPQPQPQPTYYNQPYQMMPPQQGYYYPPPYGNNMAPSAAAPPFYPGTQQPQQVNYNQSGQGDPSGASQALVAQESGGCVYYYDASQIPTYPNYPAYAAPGYGMGMSPGPDGFYYNQAAPGMAPYPG
ncbi:hypothetical protein J7T55_013561 [Diaporthe amygdali]|uniref:uncharacterized protein n=1 Tax=Phomopsis amygdali TaxID=1214568 RepID=UPI0022FEE993|nr:uncharacterized protein J7T55_013561 [Diaporthe amygdali]KAJ0119323.1 hypothetical protein J7T55_013561 [Diaporthe amygdali]